MEKKTPHYDLSAIKVDATRLGASAFTMSAMDGGRRLGLTVPEMLNIIRALNRGMFYKSMTSYGNHRIWQDVYHCQIWNTWIYIKASYRPTGGPPIISFKEKE